MFEGQCWFYLCILLKLERLIIIEKDTTGKKIFIEYQLFYRDLLS
jgi:hypothetical protein